MLNFRKDRAARTTPRNQPRRLTLESLETREVPAAFVVATTGSDANPGTDALPWRTLQKAASTVRAGDVINLRAGTYTGGVTIRAADVTVQSYPGERAAVVAPTTDATVPMAIWANARGVRVRDLDVSGGYYYAIKFEQGGGLVEGSRVHDSGRDVIKIVPGADDVVIRRNEIFNSGRRDPGNAEGIDNVNGDRMLVQDNHFHDIATTGLYAKGGATGVVIERNRVERAGTGITLGGDTDLEWFDTVANPNRYENIDGIVRNNVVIGTRNAGLSVYAALRPQVYNNTVLDAGQTTQGAVLFDAMWHGGTHTPTVSPTFVNNIVTQTVASTRPMMVVRVNGITGTPTLGNNRYYDAGGAAQFRDERGGVWVGSLAQWKARSGTDAGSSEGDPRVAADGHLLAGSPAVDAGRAVAGLVDDVDRQARAGAVDVGADEWVSAANTAPTISAVANQTLRIGGTTGPLAFTVGDAESGAAPLVVTATSSNPTLVPAAGIALGGSGAGRTVTVTPAAAQSGTATVTLTVADPGGLTASRSFTVTVTASVVTAAFVGTDTTTKGSWVGKYGSAGYRLAQGASSLPAGTAVTPGGVTNWTWAASTLDARALRKPAPATDRLAAAWCGSGAFTVGVTVPAGQTRQVTAYFLDWNRLGRAQTVQVLDARTGAVLDTRTVSNFGDGQYLSWTVTGNVTLRVTRTAGPNAVLSGVFLD